MELGSDVRILYPSFKVPHRVHRCLDALHKPPAMILIPSGSQDFQHGGCEIEFGL